MYIRDRREKKNACALKNKSHLPIMTPTKENILRTLGTWAGGGGGGEYSSRTKQREDSKFQTQNKTCKSHKIKLLKLLKKASIFFRHKPDSSF
jgi:hypothetical protein